jgi:aspartyl-tRNA(Asn)/glutamyl-tRNA(Gln) amidotransferase subunit B
LCDESGVGRAENQPPAADFKSGKAAALNFLKGQVMKLSKGKANPAVAGEILKENSRVNNKGTKKLRT